MKVSELIEHLKKFDGNLEVYSMCDHGQTPEKAQLPSEIYTLESYYSLEDYTGDEEEASEYGYTVKAVLL
jgi:hypothetical protein